MVGPFVPQVHDFLVNLGAANTQVYSEHGYDSGALRMNIHTKSLRRIKNALYPEGCVCNENVSSRIFQA